MCSQQKVHCHCLPEVKSSLMNPVVQAVRVDLVFTFFVVEAVCCHLTRLENTSLLNECLAGERCAILTFCLHVYRFKSRLWIQ